MLVFQSTGWSVAKGLWFDCHCRYIFCCCCCCFPVTRDHKLIWKHWRIITYKVILVCLFFINQYPTINILLLSSSREVGLMIAKVRARFWIYCFCHIWFVLLLLLCSWCEACKIHNMHSQPPLFSHVAVVIKSWCRLTCSCYWSSQASGDSLPWRTLLHRSVILSVMATNKHIRVQNLGVSSTRAQ